MVQLVFSSFASHWLKNSLESFKPITKRSNRNHVITFDSHLKTALTFGLLLRWISQSKDLTRQLGEATNESKETRSNLVGWQIWLGAFLSILDQSWQICFPTVVWEGLSLNAVKCHFHYVYTVGSMCCISETRYNPNWGVGVFFPPNSSHYLDKPCNVSCYHSNVNHSIL